MIAQQYRVRQAFIAVVLLLALASPASAALAVVASAINNAAGEDTSIATSSTLNVSSGNLLFCGAAYSIPESANHPATITVADTAGNTYTPISLVDNAGGWRMRTFYVANATANASNTITASFSVGVMYRAIVCVQVSGNDTAAPLDTSRTDTSASGQSITTGTFTTTTANQILFHAAYAQYNMHQFQNYLADTGNGWAIPSGGVEAVSGIVVQYKIVAAIQTNVTVTMDSQPGGGGAWTSAVATFKEAGGGGGATICTGPLLGVGC